MALKLNTAPTTEPVSLAEVKAHLRVDSEDHADDISTEQTIVPGAHVIAASYSLVGSAITVAGYSVLVNLNAGDCSAGTVTVKLQESDDNSTWTDVASGAFTAVTSANDNAIQEKAYTGTKTYLRAVCTVATGTCYFSVDVIKDYPTTVEDDLLNALIKAAREYCEGFQRRAYITQTWEMWLDEFPDDTFIELPRPPLLETAVTAGSFVAGTVYRILTVGTTNFIAIGASANTVGVVFTATGAGTGTGTATVSAIISYYDTDDSVAYIDAGDYYVDTKSTPGRVSLNYSKSWPSTTLRPRNGVCVTYLAGYGSASDVPQSVKQAMLLIIGSWYEHREDIVSTGSVPQKIPRGADALLWMDRVW